MSGPWSTPLEWSGGRGNTDHPLINYYRNCGYDHLYRCQPSVRKVIDKLVKLHGLVPFKTFAKERDGSRRPADDTPFGRLIDDPCPSRMSGLKFWGRYRAYHHLYGEAFAVKTRDSRGFPVELTMVHPLSLRFGPPRADAWRVDQLRDNRLTSLELETGQFWWYQAGQGREILIPRRDLVPWTSFDPNSEERGLSKLEALRGSLEDDAAARGAMEQMWKRGARPGYILETDDDFSERPAVIQQIKRQAVAAAGGVSNWHEPLVLDGGVKAKLFPIEENLEYLGLRRLTNTEVGAVYDLTPPAIHELERATFNNIEELLRDVLKTSMVPIMRELESVLDRDLRDGRLGEGGTPDFSDAYYAEHVTDGAMRGSPEKRIQSYSLQLQTGQRTINEVRALDNLPAVEGGDRVLVNAALIGLDDVGKKAAEAAGFHNEVTGQVYSEDVGTIFGRLSRPESISDIDIDALVDGIAPESASTVRDVVGQCFAAGLSVAELRMELKGLL